MQSFRQRLTAATIAEGRTRIIWTEATVSRFTSMTGGEVPPEILGAWFRFRLLRNRFWTWYDLVSKYCNHYEDASAVSQLPKEAQALYYVMFGFSDEAARILTTLPCFDVDAILLYFLEEEGGMPLDVIEALPFACNASLPMREELLRLAIAVQDEDAIRLARVLAIRPLSEHDGFRASLFSLNKNFGATWDELPATLTRFPAHESFMRVLAELSLDRDEICATTLLRLAIEERTSARVDCEVAKGILGS